ncbi:MAG: ATP-binding protein [Vicinamibacterales bacterium]|jgi:PAS domain S-box-containing protein
MKRHLSALVLVAGMLLAGALLAFYLQQDVKSQVIAQFNASQLLIARQAARQIESYLDARTFDIRRLFSLSSMRDLDVKAMPADVQATFGLLKAAYVQDISILDELGRVAYSTTGGATGSPRIGADVQAWAREPVNKGAVRVVVETPGNRGVPATEPGAMGLFLAAPFYREADAAGGSGSGATFAGLLVLTVDLQGLVEGSLGGSPAIGHQPSRIWVMDDGGTLLLQSEHPQMVAQNIRDTSEDCRQCHVSFDYAQNMLATKMGTSEYQIEAQDSRVAAFAPMNFQNASWIVVVNVPRDDITGFMRTTTIKTLALFGVVGTVVGFVILSIYRNSRQEVVIAEKAKHLREKERLVDQLREAGDYLDNLFESANAPIIVWNSERRITRFNRACQRLTGYPAAEAIGQELGLFFPASGREESIAKIVHSAGSEDIESPEIPILRKDGTIRIALWNSAEIRSGDRTAVIATIAQGQDITERKRAEQMKADFVSFVTHQLRTPLSGIRWLLELTGQDQTLSDDTASFIADARAAAERLITLVNDLLAVSRLEGGRLVVRPEPLDLAGLTTEVVDEVTPLIRAKNQQITVPGAAAAPLAYGDRKLVREVIMNLLSNAIKYTPPDGTITVSMQPSGDLVQWAVHDTGIGIPLASQAHLFEKFYRAENASVMNTEGTGLGLYLARLILERSGGRVWCESVEGRGSTFTFVLPAAPAPATAPEATRE